MTETAFVVVDSIPLDLSPSNPARECLGRRPVHYTMSDGRVCIVAGKHIYKDQVRIKGQPVDPQRLSLGWRWQLCMDGDVLYDYELVNDDGTIEQCRTAKPRKRRTEVEKLAN